MNAATHYVLQALETVDSQKLSWVGSKDFLSCKLKSSKGSRAASRLPCHRMHQAAMLFEESQARSYEAQIVSLPL